MKRTITYLLLLYVVVTFGVIIKQEIEFRKISAEASKTHGNQQVASTSGNSQSAATKTEQDSLPTTSKAQLPVKYLITYFHGNKRCTTCNNMENYATKSLTENFQEVLASGEMKMRILNWQNDENALYVMDYNLMGNSLVICEVNDGLEGRWKNLSRIWELAHDEEKYKQYIASEVKTFLEADNG